MSEPIEITPALLAEIEQKALKFERVKSMPLGNDNFYVFDRKMHHALKAYQRAANPAVVLAMIAEIKQLRQMESRWHKLLSDAKPGPEVLGSGFDLKKD